MEKCFQIPWDIADGITLHSLEEHYRMTKDSLDEWYDGKAWLHRDDIEHQSVLLHHLRYVIEYYGGNVDKD